MFESCSIYSGPILHYDELRDLVLCHVCMVAVQSNRLKGRNADAAFVSLLFCNYHSVPAYRLLVAFPTGKMVQLTSKHNRSASHKEAVEVTMILPSTTKNVGKQLSHQFALQKANNVKLYIIL